MHPFDPANLQASIAQVLQAADAPPDHDEAFILTGRSGETGGLEMVYVKKLSHGWALAGEFELSMRGKVSVAGAVVWTGKR
jgi:hypothetical protein